MPKSSEWEEFFDGHAPDYMSNCFVTNTVAEVDFVIEILGIAPGARILDMGCGTGRHCVELAKRGYKVTGVDLSSGMLAQAKIAAEAAGVEVELIKSNATEFSSEPVFDGAICLCEGALCLMGSGEDPVDRDLTILRNICASLKCDARFVLTALNGLRMARQKSQREVETGAFDPVTMCEKTMMEYETPEGRQSVVVTERGYAPTELVMLMRLAGLGVKHVWGGTAGNWGRRLIELDEYELMLVGIKRG